MRDILINLLCAKHDRALTRRGSRPYPRARGRHPGTTASNSNPEQPITQSRKKGDTSYSHLSPFASCPNPTRPWSTAPGKLFRWRRPAPGGGDGRDGAAGSGASVSFGDTCRAAESREMRRGLLGEEEAAARGVASFPNGGNPGGGEEGRKGDAEDVGRRGGDVARERRCGMGEMVPRAGAAASGVDGGGASAGTTGDGMLCAARGVNGVRAV